MLADYLHCSRHHLSPPAVAVAASNSFLLCVRGLSCLCVCVLLQVGDWAVKALPALLELSKKGDSVHVIYC